MPRPAMTPEQRKERVAERQAAASTIEALVFGLREHGISTLNDEQTRHRLAELSTSQAVQMIKRLEKMAPKYPAITSELIVLLKGVTQP